MCYYLNVHFQGQRVKDTRHTKARKAMDTANASSPSNGACRAIVYFQNYDF